MTFFILSHFVAEIHLFLFIIYLSKKKKKTITKIELKS